MDNLLLKMAFLSFQKIEIKGRAFNPFYGIKSPGKFI
jgi:hypothetical protein